MWTENNQGLRKPFSKIKEVAGVSNLIDIQIQSYNKFLQHDRSSEERDDMGLQGVFKSVFPITDFYDTSGQHIIYGNLGGGDEDSVFRFFYGNLDDDRPIECTLTTKYYGTDVVDTLKYMRYIEVQATVVSEYLTATLLGDNGIVKKGPKSLLMYPGRNWKRFPLANNGSLAAALALKLDYSGTLPIEILALGFEVVDTGRKVNVSSLS